MKPLICVAGKNEIALHGLRYFLDHYRDHPVCFIPNAGDSGVDGWQPSFAKQARQWGFPQVGLADIYDHENLIFISLEFDTLIKTTLFKSKNLFNFHFSKLPRYKGMFTSAHPILNGDTETAITLHLIDDGIDTGDIIDQYEVEIAPTDTARDLYFKNLKAAQMLFDANAAKLVSGDFDARPQGMLGSSYYSKHSINYSMLSIDLNRTAFEVHNQFRAFTFREFQMPSFNGWSIIRTVPTTARSTHKPGKVVSETQSHFRIATIDFDLDLYKDYYPRLWAACEVGDVDTALRCLPFIDEIDLRNGRGWTALIISAYHGWHTIVQALLQRGANPDMANYKGTTPLMYALSSYEGSRNSLAFEAIAASARGFNKSDHTGRTIFDWIEEKKVPELMAFLPS